MLSDQEAQQLMSLNKGLTMQSYDQIKSIDQNSMCVKSRQATVNIGTIGHVAHGKSTVVRAISGVNVILKDNQAQG